MQRTHKMPPLAKAKVPPPVLFAPQPQVKAPPQTIQAPQPQFKAPPKNMTYNGPGLLVVKAFPPAPVA